MNLFIVDGDLKEVELKHTKSNAPFCKFTLANHNTFTRKGETPKTETHEIQMTVWGTDALTVSEMAVGTPLMVQARVGTWISDKGYTNLQITALQVGECAKREVETTHTLRSESNVIPFNSEPPDKVNLEELPF